MDWKLAPPLALRLMGWMLHWILMPRERAQLWVALVSVPRWMALRLERLLAERWPSRSSVLVLVLGLAGSERAAETKVLKQANAQTEAD